MRLQQIPYRITHVMALLFIAHRNTSFCSLVPAIPLLSCKHYLKTTILYLHISARQWLRSGQLWGFWKLTLILNRGIIWCRILRWIFIRRRSFSESEPVKVTPLLRTSNSLPYPSGASDGYGMTTKKRACTLPMGSTQHTFFHTKEV